jgi:hypothetical protein
MKACRGKCHVEVVKLLIAARADIHEQNKVSIARCWTK